MEINKRHSFTSASVFPIKLFKTNVLCGGKIMPIHIQLILTNKCNLNCLFCSCKDRDKSEEMTLETAKKVIKTYRELGCKAATITGGGEPLLHPDINEIIRFFYLHQIKVGIVTNGLCFNKLETNTYSYIDWIRISFDDNRKFDQAMAKNLDRFIVNGNKVDWSFSYVLTSSPNYNNIQGVVNYANKNKFTHIRLVSDILNAKDVIDMEKIKGKISNDWLVIYQGRKQHTKGVRKCLISLLKPVIGVKGNIYPCCGAQYAQEGQQLDYTDYMEMKGSPEKIYERQLYFDGSDCKRCYYEDYNKALSVLLSDVVHLEFV